MTTLQNAADRKVVCEQAREWSFGDAMKEHRKEEVRKRATDNFNKSLIEWVNATDLESDLARQPTFSTSTIFVDNIVVEQWNEALSTRGYVVTQKARRFHVAIP